MNSDYVKKFTNYLQNIPAHKPSKAVVSAAGGQTDTSSPVVSKQPQSKPFMHGARIKKCPTGKGQTSATAVGGAGIRRPVWIVPTAAGSLLPQHRPQADERKFVRTCCPSRRPDSVRPEQRVDCRWEEDGKKHPPTPPSTLPPKGDVISVEECSDTPELKVSSLGNGDGLGDNVNHHRSPGHLASEDPTAGDGHDKTGQKRTSEEFRDGQSSSWAGMLSKAHPSTQPAIGKRKNSFRGDAEDTTDCSLDEAGQEYVEASSTSEHYKQLFTFQPIRTLQFLTLELTTKIRDLGSEHRPLYKIGKELSDVVKILTQQQLDASKISTPAAGHPKTGRKPECENCQLLQRSIQSERERHAQESSQQNETINNLKLELAHNMEATDAVTEQYRRLEEQCAQLKLAVDTKKSLELELIQDLRRKAKEARCKEQQLEQERSTMETRLMEALMKNEQMEFLLHTQDNNFSRVKSELSTIHKLSAKQIEFLDDPGDVRASKVASSLRQRRQARLRSESDSSTCISNAAGVLSSEIFPSKRQPTTSSPPRAATEGEQRNGKARSKGTSLPEKPAITLEPDSMPTESMPSLAASLSDQDNSSHARRSTARRRISTSSDSTTAALARLALASKGTAARHEAAPDRSSRDNDCEDRWSVHTSSDLRIDGEHDDNHSRQRANPSYTLRYSTGRSHRKFDEAGKLSARGTLEGHQSDVNGAVKWQNGDDKNHHHSSSPAPWTSRDNTRDSPYDSSPVSCAADYGASDERCKKMDGLSSHSTVHSRPATRSGGQLASSPVTLDDHQQFVAELAGE
uniref:Uncharacterized protein n=1 Tax=Anopheles atroparvus TaxID=41427 RepID=A0A182JD62_ANOAO